MRQEHAFCPCLAHDDGRAFLVLVVARDLQQSRKRLGALLRERELIGVKACLQRLRIVPRDGLGEVDEFVTLSIGGDVYKRQSLYAGLLPL